LEVESRQGAFIVLTDRVIRFEDYVQVYVEQESTHHEKIVLSESANKESHFVK